MSFTHLDAVLAEVDPVGRLFADAGYRLFLVGGIVRDQWLDEPLDASSDIDLTTNALPAEIKKIVASFAESLWTQGERFGTIGLRAGGRDYEITTHRAESYTSDSRKPEVSFGDDIETDLSRRDFTVNAMAIELPAGALVDPFDGASDLEARRLRTPLSAEISFGDDPLRMLRAARFMTRFGLQPVDELVQSATALHERLRIVAIERIGVEVRRLLGLLDASPGLNFLAHTGLLAEVLSYGEPSLIDEIEPKLPLAVQIARGVPNDWHLRLAGIGLAVFDDVSGVQAMCQRLRMSRDDERAIVAIARAVVGVIEAPDTKPETIRRWIRTDARRVDQAEFEQRAATGLASHRFDIEPILMAHMFLGTGPGEPFVAALQELVDAEEVDNISFLDGDEIMAVLGIAPGPAIGQAHAVLQDRYIEQGPLSEAEQRDVLRSWWADRASDL